ncbi:MAG: hypothetical protein HYZ57_09950 [Acidobacteria bacterium]|nr:hypothetical protein [Acidobacteriota bacterium]MBI3280150.1 hypothetical protein [Acidobacteriota bacterium]
MIRTLVLGGALLLPVFLASPAVPYKGQAAMAAVQAWKLAVRPPAQVVYIGQKVALQVSLLNANEQEVAAVRNVDVLVEITCPSGKLLTISGDIDEGKTHDLFGWQPAETGICKIVARQKRKKESFQSVVQQNAPPDYDRKLLEGFDSVMVLRKRTMGTPSRKPVRAAPRGPGAMLPRTFGPSRLAMSFAARPDGDGWQADESKPAAAARARPDSGSLIFEIQQRDNAAIWADGQDAAIIKVWYASDSGLPAQRDIRVWIERSHGKLEPEQPLIIRAHAHVAEARLTSEWPADARIRFVSSAPPLPVAGSPGPWTVRFATAILGIAPNGPGWLTLVDRPALVAHFFDHNGNPAATATRRHVRFVPSNTYIAVQPDAVEVEPGSSDASVLMLPVSVGSSEITLLSPGLPPAVHTVSITIGILIACCLIGGLFGALCAYLQKRKDFLATAVTGIAGALVLASVYVFGLVPIVKEVALLRNIVSVIVVSLVGGYSGVYVLEWARGRLLQKV